MTLNKEFCLGVMECGAYEPAEGPRGCEQCQISKDPLETMDLEDCALVQDLVDIAKRERGDLRVCKNAARCPLEFPPAPVEDERGGMHAVRLYIETSTVGHCKSCGGTIFYPHMIWGREHICVSCGQNAGLVRDPSRTHTVREERV